MKAFDLGDLIRFLPDSGSKYEHYGIVLSKKKFNDHDGNPHNFLAVLWSDGGMGYIRDDMFKIRINLASKILDFMGKK